MRTTTTATTSPRAIILDMGNVLIFHDNAKLARALSQRSGKPEAEIDALLGSSSKLGDAINRGDLDEEGIYREVSRALGLAVPMPEFEALWSCHFDIHHQIMPLVTSLVGRVKLVLLSNTNALHVRYCRSVLPILEDFDALLFSNEVRLVKPERAFYEQAVSSAGEPPAACVFFDDLERYVQAAREAGVRAQVFTTADAFRLQLAALGL